MLNSIKTILLLLSLASNNPSPASVQNRKWALIPTSLLVPSAPSFVAEARVMVLDGKRTTSSIHRRHHGSSTNYLPHSKTKKAGKKNLGDGDHHHSDDRRANSMPWLSIIILLNVLFFFKSFAAPFFDPLVSIYYLSANQYQLHLFFTELFAHNDV